MNRFNLTFSGEILADHDPARVKLRFGKMFAIDDPVRLERFFSGQTIILRRNLERKAAAQYYHELHLLGVVPALVKVTPSEAAREEQEHRTAQDNARKQANAAASRRLAEEQIVQRAAEKKRQAELDAARPEAIATEVRRKAAEKAAKEAEEVEERARLQAEREEVKRQKAKEATRIKVEARRKQAEAQRKAAERRRAAAEKVAAQREQAALSAVLQEKVVQRAATKMAPSAASKPTKARIKTTLEVPQRNKTPTPEAVTTGQRKRQPGEPNLYTLRPFRNTDEVRARAGQAQQRGRQSYALGALALAALLLLGGSYLRHTADPVISGASAVAIDPQFGPVLLAANSLLFHDRAGVSTNEVRLSTLGVSTLEAPLAFDDSGALLALGQLFTDRADPAAAVASQLLRCELALSTCQYFSPELDDRRVGAFVIHPLDGSLLLVDPIAGQLLKVNRAGKIVASAAAPIPDDAVLRLHGGLLLMNSAEGPGVSVLRYEDSAFGQQLDEILLLPPPALQAQQSRVGDFLWSGNAWWASLYNPESGSIGLYRFDSEWNYLNEVELPVATGPLQLSNWGTKILVSDSRHLPIQRFNDQGAIEAPFVSTQLAELLAKRQGHSRLAALAWRGGLLACALTAALGFGFGYLQSLRRLVYKPRREQGAAPVDDYTNALLWIDPVLSRPALLRRWSVRYGLLLLGIVLLAIAQSMTAGLLAALLLALSGPGIVLLLLSRRPIGHIGILQDRLLLVDHSGMYHLARGSSVQYRGPFLLIDDVVVFCGNHLLPAFAPLQLQNLVHPLALGGVKVDRDTIVVKLLQSRHPFALGACAILVTATTAAMLLCLQGIF